MYTYRYDKSSGLDLMCDSRSKKLRFVQPPRSCRIAGSQKANSGDTIGSFIIAA